MRDADTSRSRPGSAPPSLSPLVPGLSPSGAQSPVDGHFSGNVDIGGGKSFHLACVGSGSPTVILVHAFGGSTADWGPVLDLMDGVTHTCAVDRIGSGDSSPANEDRTTSAMVDDLHTLLDVAGVATPVVLVGHSIAGFDLRLHAGRYPDDVAGMVFVDPSSVGQLAVMQAALATSSRTEQDPIPGDLRTMLEAGWPAPSTIPERYDIAASEADVAAVTSFGNTPVIVLSAGSSVWPTRSALEDAWFALHDDLVGMTSNGRRDVILGAGHYIQIDRPDAVVEAIAELVKVARPVERDLPG